MTEFQVGVIETEERKETLYSQTPLYREERGERIQDFWGAPLRNGVTEWRHKQILIQNASCIRMPQVISGGWGGGVAHPLQPSPRSAPTLRDNHLIPTPHNYRQFDSPLKKESHY